MEEIVFLLLYYGKGKFMRQATERSMHKGAYKPLSEGLKRNQLVWVGQGSEIYAYECACFHLTQARTYTNFTPCLTCLCKGSPVELNLYYFGLPHLCLRDFLPSNNGITNWPSSGLALSPLKQARPLHLQAERGFPTLINA